MLRALALPAAAPELSVSLVDDAEMRTLNCAYRGRDRATDVLAFPGDVDGRTMQPASVANRGDRPLVLGDVVISIDTAAAQARAMRTTVARRLDALLIHGVLHLLGYDHEISPAEARRMSRRARELERALPPTPRVAEVRR